MTPTIKGLYRLEKLKDIGQEQSGFTIDRCVDNVFSLDSSVGDPYMDLVGFHPYLFLSVYAVVVVVTLRVECVVGFPAVSMIP